MNILDRPTDAAWVNFCEGFGQRFLVTVDTEEEFDWNAPLSRSNHGTASIPALARFQAFCEEAGIVPVYLIDYPVATSPVARDVLGDAVRANRAELGVQLHPWVSPPFEEDVNAYNSYAGNLPAELEQDKIQRLRAAIEETIGAAPLIYRAGRYGVGPNSAEILLKHGLAIDSSVRARFDYSHTGGPNFREHPLRPYWIDPERRLMELPLTTVYWGPLRQLGNAIYPRLWRTPRVRGLLARAGLLERIALTPEGVTAEEALRGVDIALDDGLPVLVFSFHSPSLAPGHTPYVRDDADLERLYEWWRRIFAYLGRRNVKPTCVRDIMASVSLA